MIFTAQRTMIIKEFQSLDSLHAQKTKLTFIHTLGKNYKDGHRGSVRIRADRCTSRLLSVLWSHDFRTTCYVIKRGNTCDAFEKHLKKSVLSFLDHIYNLIGDYKQCVCGQDSHTDKWVPVIWNATSM